MSNQTEKQLLTVKEVAAILGLGASSIWRQVKLGHIPEPVRIGGSTRWRKFDIDKIVRPLDQTGNDDQDPDPDTGLGGTSDPGPDNDPDAALRAEADMAHGLAEDGYAA